MIAAPERIGIAAAVSAMASEVVEVAGAFALRAPEAPASPMLNRIVGLGVEQEATEEQLDAAIEAMTGLRFYVTLSPSAQPAGVAGWLRARGFERGWGWMQFRRGVESVPDIRSDLRLVEVGPDARGDFARVVRAAYDLPSAVEPLIAAAVGRDGWTCWLACAGDEPAAGAALFAEDGAGYLGFAGTAPEHRGRGAQGALLAARIRRARDLGCDVVYTETGELRPGYRSASYRNILRAGFEELYVLPNWLNPPSGPGS